MQSYRYVWVKQIAGCSEKMMMEAREKELLDRMSRCVRVWVALAKSGAPAERGDRKGRGGALEKVAGTT
jgi:hypothetical protein